MGLCDLHIAWPRRLGPARRYKLSQNALRDSLSLAATANSALGQTRLGELRCGKAWRRPTPVATVSLRALLAQAGVSGPYQSFEGKSGFLQQICGPLDLSRLGASPLRAGIVYLKRWPVFYSAQGAVDAAIKLREKVKTCGNRNRWSWNPISACSGAAPPIRKSGRQNRARPPIIACRFV